MDFFFGVLGVILIIVIVVTVIGSLIALLFIRKVVKKIGSELKNDEEFMEKIKKYQK